MRLASERFARVVIGVFCTVAIAFLSCARESPIPTDEGAEVQVPVVLLHGLGSSAQLNWVRPGTVKTLSDHGYRVIAHDFPESAHGVQMVEDVIRLLDASNISRAHIVGYSMGGMVALKLATMHPTRVQSVVLGGMGWMPADAPTQKYWASQKNLRARSLADLATTAEEMKAIAIPMIVIVGERDRVRELYVDPLADVRPDIPVKIVAGADHSGCANRPEFQQLLLDWLQRIR
jgi:pimeloyl-ACP methyl ester carboxylesterase